VLAGVGRGSPFEKWIVARAMKAATIRAKTTARMDGILARLGLLVQQLSSAAGGSWMTSVLGSSCLPIAFRFWAFVHCGDRLRIRAGGAVDYRSYGWIVAAASAAGETRRRL